MTDARNPIPTPAYPDEARPSLFAANCMYLLSGASVVLLLLLASCALLGIRLLERLLDRRYGELVLKRRRRQRGRARARVLLHLTF